MKHEFDNRANNPSPNHIFSEIGDTLFSTASDAMLVVNGAGEFIEVNTVGCELTGYGRTALLTLSLPDLFFAVTDGERPLSFSDLSPAKNGQCDCVLRDRDGRSFSVDIKTHSLADNRTLLIVHPTARHPAPASEYTFLRNVLNTIPDAVWLKDPDGVYLTANPMFERFIGLKEADLLGKTDYDLFEPELAEFFRRHDRNAVLAGKPTINEEWVTMAVGDHRVLLETVKTPLYDEAGQLLGVLGVARDITEREQAEVAIKKLAKFPDENPHPIMRVTQDGAVLYGNQASARLLKKWGCTVGQPLPNVWRQHIQGTLVSGVSREKEIAVDGRVFSLSIVPLVEYGYVNIYGYDITERRRVEQAIYLMSEAQQQIAHLDSLLGVYQLVGEKVQELLGDAFTASSMFDEKIQAMRIAGLYGFVSRYENLVRRFNIDPSRMTYSLADMTAEELRMFRSGQLEKFEGGLYALLTRKVPRQICEAAEKRLKIASIYTMGFVWNDIHYGGLTILAKKDIAPYKEMIETIMNQAAIAINRLKSEEALRESEEKLRLFIEHAPASLAMFDREMRYLAVSHRWLADYNLGNQDVIGRSHYDVFPEIPERWKAVHRRGLAGEVIQADEDEFLRADGTIQWERWEVRPWYTADGAIGGIVIFTEDITERKQARKALQESQDILTTAESVAKIGSWKWDLNTQKVTWSKEMFHLFGIDAENFDDDVNKVIKNRVHPDDIEAVNQSNLSVLEHSNPLPLEYRIILPDGTERLVWAEGRLIYDQLGNPTALVGYVQDITERKQAEQAIRESEERYHNTLENMLEGCQIIGFDWRYLYLNASAARHGRCPQEELLGRTMMEAYPGIENTDMFAVLRRCMAERTPYRLENKFQYGDGSFAWFDLSIQPVPEGLFILSIDITERKQAETALQEMAENMAEAQRMTHYGSWEVRLTPELEFIDPQIWSDECYRIFGVEPGSIQITKDYFYAHVHSEDREAAQQALWRAIHDGTEAVYEYRLFRPDGSIRNIHDRIKVVLDEQSGRPVKVVGIVQDITESKQAEATIDQLHRRMEMILNSAGEGIYGTDVNGRITFVNPAMAQMTGWELNELLGQDAHAVFHHTRADDTPYPADECTIRLAMQDGRSYHTDDDMYWHKEGTPL
ncbi:MAG: PAS domain S-box protein, partial [Anaerolineae bacterium]